MSETMLIFFRLNIYIIILGICNDILDSERSELLIKFADILSILFKLAIILSISNRNNDIIEIEIYLYRNIYIDIDAFMTTVCKIK